MPDRTCSHPPVSGQHPLTSNRSKVADVPVFTGEEDEGERVGRFVTVRDVNGQRHAVAANGVSALCETDDGTLLLLPGGRMIHIAQPLRTVMRWLSG